MLKNIVFDFGGVICRFSHETILRPFCKTQEDYDLLYPIVFKDWQGLDEGRLDYDVYAREAIAALPERLMETGRQFFEISHTKMPPIEGTWALIARLKARGYHVYLLSNASTWFAAHLDDFPITRLMDGHVVSAPLKIFKPNAEIYQYVLDQFSLGPDETHFIDDNPVNARAAEAVGMHGYAFDGDAEKLQAYIEARS